MTFERDIGPSDTGLAFPFDHEWDPVVAVNPADPETMVVAYVTPKAQLVAACGAKEVAIGLRRTVDGGLSWHDTAAHFWHAGGLCTSIHPSIAWGPGPRPGRYRLYFADTGYPCRAEGLCVLISFSDDAGDTWSMAHVERPPSVLRGSVPDVTVDVNPASPNYGTVYVVYNWQPRDGSPLWAARGGQAYNGLHLLASRDFGRTWTRTALDRAPSTMAHLAGYLVSPGARVRTAPDGNVYVAFAQLNLSSSFDLRWRSSAGSRWVYAIQRLSLGPDGRFRKSATVSAIDLGTRSLSPGFLPFPGVSRYLDVPNGLDVDQSTDMVYLAVDDYNLSARRGVPRGHVRVGRSSDRGRSWQWATIPDLPDVGDRRQSSVKATISISPGGDRIFVGFHGLTDVPVGTAAGSHRVTVGNFYSVSTDGGKTFSAPTPISRSRWNTEAVAGAQNAVGLRDRSQFVSGDKVIFVYGDARNAGFTGSPSYGNSDIFGALVELGVP